MLMRRGVLLVLCAPLLAQTGAVQRLAEAVRDETPVFTDLSELCDGIGGRPTGSAACRRAVAWAAKKFREAGAENVRTESYRVPALWLPVSAASSALVPERFPLRLMAAPGTPGVTLPDARLVTKLDENARGKVLLVPSEEMKTLSDLFGEYLRTPALLADAKKSGVAAILLQSMQPRELLSRHPVVMNGELETIPVALVAREQAGRLERLAARGEVRLRLDIVNRTGPAYQADNVIAEIRGREKPEAIVVIGAHLDSWDSGTGAEDDGANCAMLIDLARQMRRLELRPRRTVRFILFTGEEQGMWGSSGYVRTHLAEMDRHVAMVAFDMGSGKTSGFFLNGREDLRAPLESVLRAAGIEGLQNTGSAIDGTDNFDFLLAGVPNLVALQDEQAYTPDYHAESDTFDKVNQTELKNNAALAAAVVWGFADLAEWPLKRQSRAEVEELLKRTRIDEQMKLFGQWKAWEEGKRP
jgi:carboxypeptidase Q